MLAEEILVYNKAGQRFQCIICKTEVTTEVSKIKN